MSCIRRGLYLLFASLMLLMAGTCLAQGANAPQAASGPPIVIDQSVLNAMVKAQSVDGHPDQVQLSRDQMLSLMGSASDAERSRVMRSLIIA